MVDYEIKYLKESNEYHNYSEFILGSDIGGTNTNIAIAGLRNNELDLLFKLKFETKKISSLIPCIKKTIEVAKKNNICIEFACIGAAGVVTNDLSYVDITNANLKINTEEITKKTEIKKIFIINDFQAIGYGLNVFDFDDKEKIITIKNGETKKQDIKKTKIVIGAGTGFGKAILTYNKKNDAFIPISSEGGHVDFPAQNDFEIKLINFIKKFRNIKENICYEEILSGRGIEAIYYFLIDEGYNTDKEVFRVINDSDDKASIISKYKTKDDACRETFSLFSKFYGRCAKNYALDTLSLGGVYIAGGISQKNIEIFKTKTFLDEFENSNLRRDFLKKIPIYLILDYDISLIGSCFAANYNYIKNKDGG